MNRVRGLGDLRRDPLLDEDPVPEQEHQHRPDLAAVVDRAVAVGVEQARHGAGSTRSSACASRDDAARPVVHLVAQPVPDRHREAELAPVQHVRGDDALERLAQRELRRPLGDLRSTAAASDATANTSGSRNGTRSSSEFAIVILSALTRMSPRSQVNRSTCCIRATGSQPADSA